jgi:hypothetical protein
MPFLTRTGRAGMGFRRIETGEVGFQAKGMRAFKVVEIGTTRISRRRHSADGITRQIRTGREKVTAKKLEMFDA